MNARALILALFFIASLFSFSCADNDSENVNISAAASLQNVLNDLKLIYEAKYDGNLIINYAGSYTLSFQINQGMKSDVFIPAGSAPVQKLENKQNNWANMDPKTDQKASPTASSKNKLSL